MSIAVLDDGEALAQSIHTISTSLEEHHKSTLESLSILDKIDHRLSSLESNMAPIRLVTEQLTRAEHHVTQSYAALRRIHKNFRVCADADVVLRKGLGAPIPALSLTSAPTITEEDRRALDAYMQILDRVHAALSFLRVRPRIRSGEAAIRHLDVRRSKLLAEMKEEIVRLIVQGSCCTAQGPSGRLSPLGESPLYQHTEPIALNISRRIRDICESMARAGDMRWADAYARARGSKIEEAVTVFLHGQQQSFGGGGGKGGETRLSVSVLGGASSSSGGFGGASISPPRFVSGGGRGDGEVGERTALLSTLGRDVAETWLNYLHFLREIIKGEEIMFLRTLPMNFAQSIRAWEDMMGQVLIRVCKEMTEALDVMLGREKTAGEKALLLLAVLTGMEHQMPAFEQAFANVTKHASSPGSPFPPSLAEIPASTTVKPHHRARPSSTSLSLRPLSKAFAAVSHPKGNIVPASPLASPPSSGSSPPLAHVHLLYRHVCRLTITHLQTFLDDVLNDSISSHNLPRNASVHVVTSNTLRTFKRIIAYHEIFEHLPLLGGLALLPWESEEDRAALTRGKEETEGQSTGEEQQETHLRIYAHQLFMNLLKNIQGKTEAYHKMDGGVDKFSAAGQPLVFLMNNAHYMVSTIEASSSLEEAPPVRTAPTFSWCPSGTVSLTSVVSEAFMDRLRAVTNDSRTKFTASVWADLAEVTTNDKSLPDVENNSGGHQLTFERGRLVKARFSAFNTAMEEIYNTQKSFLILDAGLRMQLREEAKAAFLPPYTSFFDKFSGTQFSKKHMDQYLRFSPATVKSMIDELYAG